MSVITAPSGIESRVLLRDISWETYETLRAVEDNWKIRMTYDRGNLELMSPSKRHERLGYLIGRLIDAWTEELNIPMQGCRTTTFKRKDLQKGLEPDNCYYIRNEPLVRERDDLDLEIDPPPDLVVEIDVSTNSLGRLPIFAALGVPEVWRCDGETLEVYELGADGQYARCDKSPNFPALPPSEVMRILERRTETDETSLIRMFRRWIRDSIPTESQGREDTAE